MAAQLQNVWHLRKVAEPSAKPCDICYKPTASVLITPDQKDHFYICPGHLKDKGFCTAIVDEAEAAAKKRKEELDREIELIKKEYEEKLKQKKKGKKPKDTKEKEKGKSDHTEDNKNNEDDEKAEREKNDKISALVGKGSSSASDEGPRIFALQKAFFQRRLDRIRNMEIAKRNRERLKSPTLFPSVPSGSLG